jgi:hypothetical protein
MRGQQYYCSANCTENAMTRLLILAAGLALASAAAANPNKPAAVEHSSYFAYATGESLPEIRYTELHNWQRDSDSSIILWTRPNRAYLVTLENECWDLRNAKTIKVAGVDAFERRLRTTDELQFDNRKCPVEEIRAIDLDAMKRGHAEKT